MKDQIGRIESGQHYIGLKLNIYHPFIQLTAKVQASGRQLKVSLNVITALVLKEYFFVSTILPPTWKIIEGKHKQGKYS